MIHEDRLADKVREIVKKLIKFNKWWLCWKNENGKNGIKIKNLSGWKINLSISIKIEKYRCMGYKQIKYSKTLL